LLIDNLLYYIIMTDGFCMDVPIEKLNTEYFRVPSKKLNGKFYKNSYILTCDKFYKTNFYEIQKILINNKPDNNIGKKNYLAEKGTNGQNGGGFGDEGPSNYREWILKSAIEYNNPVNVAIREGEESRPQIEDKSIEVLKSEYGLLNILDPLTKLYEAYQSKVAYLINKKKEAYYTTSISRRNITQRIEDLYNVYFQYYLVLEDLRGQLPVYNEVINQKENQPTLIMNSPVDSSDFGIPSAEPPTLIMNSPAKTYSIGMGSLAETSSVISTDGMSALDKCIETCKSQVRGGKSRKSRKSKKSRKSRKSKKSRK